MTVVRGLVELLDDDAAGNAGTTGWYPEVDAILDLIDSASTICIVSKCFAEQCLNALQCLDLESPSSRVLMALLHHAGTWR